MKTLLLFLALTTFAPAQQWYPLVPSESTTTSVTLPAGTQYRFGAANCANPVVGSTTPGWQVATLTAPQTINPVSMAGGTASFGFADPCYGVVKELDVLETAAPQNISMTVNGVTKIVTVPALPVTPTPTASPAAGTFTAAQTVMLADSLNGAMIYYSLTGTASQSSTLYSVPISITATSTLSYLACMSGYQCSAPQSGTWTINIPPPVTTVNFTCPGTATGTLTGTVIGNLTFTQTGPCVTGANQ